MPEMGREALNAQANTGKPSHVLVPQLCACVLLPRLAKMALAFLRRSSLHQQAAAIGAGPVILLAAKLGEGCDKAHSFCVMSAMGNMAAYDFDTATKYGFVGGGSRFRKAGANHLKRCPI